MSEKGLVKPTPRNQSARSTDGLRLQTVKISATLTSRAYDVLRRAIMEMPIYDGDDNDLRLDERALAEGLGISRTPVREALLRLEIEGIVQTIPRRGVYVVRKTKAEIVEVIVASAALEAAAARLAADRATDEEIAALRAQFPQFSVEDHLREAPSGELQVDVPVHEYSELNLSFHQQLADLAHSELFSQLIGRLQIHMRSIRQRTIGDDGRMARSVVDHAHIIEAIEARDGDQAERRVRQHALDLAEHVRNNLTNLV